MEQYIYNYIYIYIRNTSLMWSYIVCIGARLENNKAFISAHSTGIFGFLLYIYIYIYTL